jgi:flagellar basal body rod protein FlgG
MKPLFFVLFTLISSASYAENYSGIWKDAHEQFYSIHQSEDSIVIAELRSQKATISPFEQGNLEFTNNQLDLAIMGSGFFVMELEDGSHAYTRKGHFFLSTNGFIINEQGQKLLTEKGKPLPNDIVELVIEDTGTINLRDKEKGLLELDRIKLASVAPKDLQYYKNLPITANKDAVTYFYPSEKRGGIIHQGALEMLNYTSRDWVGYIGKLIDNQASIESFPSTADPSHSIDIQFDSASTATLTTKDRIGLQPIAPDCNSSSKCSIITEKQLTKIY